MIVIRDFNDDESSLCVASGSLKPFYKYVVGKVIINYFNGIVSI